MSTATTTLVAKPEIALNGQAQNLEEAPVNKSEMTPSFSDDTGGEKYLAKGFSIKPNVAATREAPNGTTKDGYNIKNRKMTVSVVASYSLKEDCL